MFAAANTTLGLTQRVKFVLIAGFLALSLLVGASATATHVGAQPVDRGLDGFSNACADLQDQANALVAEYSRVGRANAYDPRLGDILAQLRSLGTSWQQIGCQDVYGNIVGLQLVDTSKTGISRVNTGGFTEQGAPPQAGVRPVNTGVFSLAG